MSPPSLPSCPNVWTAAEPTGPLSLVHSYLFWTSLLGLRNVLGSQEAKLHYQQPRRGFRNTCDEEIFPLREIPRVLTLLVAPVCPRAVSGLEGLLFWSPLLSAGSGNGTRPCPLTSRRISAGCTTNGQQSATAFSPLRPPAGHHARPLRF